MAIPAPQGQHCGEWGVFYHSYSFGALAYELHSALAAVLFDMPSGGAPLPRLRMADFKQLSDAAALVEAGPAGARAAPMRRHTCRGLE